MRRLDDVLIIDDESDIRRLISGILEDEGYGTRQAAESDGALRELELRRPSLTILDVWLQGSRLDGLALLDAIRNRYPQMPVIIISGHGTIDTAVSAIKKGAYDYVEKPFKTERLLALVHRGLETARLRRDNSLLREREGLEGLRFVGDSSSAKQLRKEISSAASGGSRVFLLGPPGSGKELAARLIHAESSRKDEAFAVLGSASLASDRMERALFGSASENGSPPLIGALEKAHGGSLLLDEVVDMPLEAQGRILHAILEETFERLEGDGARIRADVRILSASGRDPSSAIESGRLREDLYHRLNVLPIEVPPLSRRREDVPLLAEWFADRLSLSGGLPRRRFADDALAALQSYEWRGNARQLRNYVERVLISAGGDSDSPITASMLPRSSAGSSSEESGIERLISLPLKEARSAFEREYVRAQLSRFDGNVSKAASFIGMDRAALHRKMRSLGLEGGSSSCV